MIPKNFIYTYSGVSFSPLYASTDDIKGEDIAHALSYICRANGHFSGFYSVAQHCLSCVEEAVAREHPRHIQLACLLHDASEAFISDITRPVKLELPEYREIEKRLQAVIYRRYGLDPDDGEMLAAVREIDDAMLYHEFLALGGLALFDTAPEIITKPDYSFIPFEETEKRFLQTLSALYITEEKK